MTKTCVLTKDDLGVLIATEVTRRLHISDASTMKIRWTRDENGMRATVTVTPMNEASK